MNTSVAINDIAVVTPFGTDTDSLWKNLISGKTAVNDCTRFPVDKFACRKCSALNLKKENHSLFISLLEKVSEKIRSWNADFLILATTKGKIDILEQVCREKNHSGNSNLSTLLPEILEYLNIRHGLLVSAACASSSTGIARGCEMLLAGRASRIAVVGIDIVSQFVFSGFSALQALSADNENPTPAKPFDSKRDGLILGEACAAVLLEKKYSEQNIISGKIRGWGNASDANHVTGPSRDGSGLVSAISAALEMSGISPAQIGAISAHGTGTVYNDSMEMQAFRKIFSHPLPVFSVKGALGHTMGASGTLETIISLCALRNSTVPRTIGFHTPDELSANWVSSSELPLEKEYILKTNSGFGGINSALILNI